MKGTFASFVLLALTGCSVVPPDAWTFDPTRPSPKVSLPVGELTELTEQVAQLQLERNAIRARIAAEPDAGARLGLYGQLHAVGMDLSPLDRRLGRVAAGR
jgi:hypothetical protein